MKNQKGITLIALIVTIIVLLILAGVAIATLTGDNSVLRQTNSAKVASIEGTAKEEVNLACAAMRLAIAETQASDNSYVASAHTSAIKAKLLEVIKADTSLVKAGWTAADNNNTSFKILYKGTDYQQATNDANATITFTITLSQSTIEITNSATGLKAQNGESGAKPIQPNSITTTT